MNAHPKRRLLTRATVLVAAALSVAGLATPPVLAAPRAAAAEASVQNLTPTRAEALQRARSWVDVNVKYTQFASHTNQYGTYRMDCSGLVSLAWGLDSSLTTFTLPNVGTWLNSLDDLKPGDALNNVTEHVSLFVSWADAGHTVANVYEETSYGGPEGPDPGSIASQWTRAKITNGNYRGLRYNGIRESGGGSLNGDARSEIATVLPSGQIKAWHNYKGFADRPYGSAAAIAEGFAKDNVWFPDIDGDGIPDIATVLPNGDVKAWRNYKGFDNMPFGEAAVIGQGFAKDNLKFADIDGDGKDDIITVLGTGEVKSWRNYKGFANMPFGEAAVIGEGFAKDNLKFADIDGDGKDDIITVLGTGEVKSWRNYKGFADRPFGEAAIIGEGFTKNNVEFPDIDGDGRDDIATVVTGDNVKSWRNYKGFANMPFGEAALIAEGFTADNVFFL